MIEDKDELIEWLKRWYKQSNEDNLPLFKWLVEGDEVSLSERIDRSFYEDVFQALYDAGKFDVDWLLDYLAYTGELQAWYEEGEFLEEED